MINICENEFCENEFCVNLFGLVLCRVANNKTKIEGIRSVAAVASSFGACSFHPPVVNRVDFIRSIRASTLPILAHAEAPSAKRANVLTNERAVHTMRAALFVMKLVKSS